MLINRLLMACGCHHFEARQRQEVPECWRHFSISSWPEVCRAHTIACKQVSAKNYSRTKWHYLVKITSWMTYNHINLSQKEPDKRKMNQNGSEISLRETIICVSLESTNVMSEHFSFLLPALESHIRCSHNGGPPVIWIISLYLWYQVYFVILLWNFWLLY